MTFALAIPPLTVKNRPVCLFGQVHLIGRIQYNTRKDVKARPDVHIRHVKEYGRLYVFVRIFFQTQG